MKDIQVFTALDAKTVAAEKLDILLLSTEGAADMATYNDLEKLKAAFPGKKVAAMADKMFNQDNTLADTLIRKVRVAGIENRRNALEKEQAALQARNEELRANLLRTISHDLRTPLTSISGNASNLLSNGETLDTETRNKICTDIFDDAQWLIGLVENLLSITRIEDGRMNLQISPQLMDEMIEEALHHVNRKSCEHTITTQYGDEILLVNVDARLIMQVVVNLVDNAIKYTPVGSVIQISAYRKDHQVVVEVADNGPGIPDRAKAQVFEMFYTGQSRIADSHRSLGLGLPLCRAILTAHGGTLTLRDNIPNGSVFSFALPQSEVNIHE